MSDFAYDILEYFGWITLALALAVILSVCLVAALAISSIVHSLTAKWNLITNSNHRQLTGPAG